MPDEYVPTWNGDPASFESFVTACEWYSIGLKDQERKLAASRIWQRLTGAAKSVVKHLNPSDFDSPAGLNKLLAILRDSPLQKLPVPDSFSRLERWTGLRRNHAETIPQLLVREEELFVELQNALKRARADRIKTTATGVGTGEKERDPSVSPSRSPQFAASKDAEEAEESGAGRGEDHPGAEGGFFEDELRGYRLLKAAKLSASERQRILTLTKNSTHFVAVRRALRTLFAEETTEDSRAAQGRRVWWTEGSEEWPVYHMDDETYSEWSPGGWWSEDAHGPEVYWGDDWSASWEDGPEAWTEEWPAELEEPPEDAAELGVWQWAFATCCITVGFEDEGDGLDVVLPSGWHGGDYSSFVGRERTTKEECHDCLSWRLSISCSSRTVWTMVVFEAVSPPWTTHLPGSQWAGHLARWVG